MKDERFGIRDHVIESTTTIVLDGSVSADDTGGLYGEVVTREVGDMIELAIRRFLVERLDRWAFPDQMEVKVNDEGEKNDNIL